MKKHALIMVAALSVWCSSKYGYCDSGLSYRDTVALIKETMSTNTSLFRKESYGSISFDGCKLRYNVAGTYPAGGTYDIKYSNIDFSSLNPDACKTSHDYTAFLELNFNNYLEYNTGDAKLRIRTIVINTSDDAASQTLLKGFLHLGELCKAESGSTRQ